jgi:hypothetical protein
VLPTPSPRPPAAAGTRGSSAPVSAANRKGGWWSLAGAAILLALPASALKGSSPQPTLRTEMAPGTAASLSTADFGDAAASADARRLFTWVIASHDNQALPFLIVDKIAARVFVFGPQGAIKGASAALLGISRRDDGVPGIGKRRLATITPAERTTPAGRFQAALGHDFEQDILWIDYEAALSLHRVIVGKPEDHRAQRLASPSVLDNRISYGCINVPAAFYDGVVKPAFTGTVGIVYILPETRNLGTVFAIDTLPRPAGAAPASR